MSRSRTYTWDDPLAGAREGLELSGLDYLRAMAEGRLPKPPFASTVDMNIAEYSQGFAAFTAVPQEFHYNPIGAVHGGLAATLLDSAMSCSIHTTLEPGERYTTVELKVNFVRAIGSSSGRIRAEGRVIHRGRTIATAEGRLFVEEGGKLLAHGTTTCMIMPLKERPA